MDAMTNDSRLASAIDELERSTEALIETSPSDFAGLAAALDRRAEAVALVASLAAEPGVCGRADVGRMKAAVERGEAARRKLLAIRQDATEDWLRSEQLARSVDGRLPPAPPTINYSA